MLDWMIVCFGLALINAAIAMWGVQRFLGATTEIASQKDLTRFQHMARGQMHQALIQLLLLSAGGLLGGYGVFTGEVGLAWVLGLNGMIIGMGALGRVFEKQAQNLPANPEFAETYRANTVTWEKKALPDF